MTAERIRLTRAELYERVWATPMRTLAKEFGMSDVGLAKVCRKHDIPVPPVGYWRRKETGYKVKRPLLRPRKDGPEHLDIYIRERLRPEFQELARQVAPTIAIAPDISHPLALKSEKLLDTGKLNQRSLATSKNGTLAHILVSREQLPRALKVLNALLLALEERSQPTSWPKQENALLSASIDGEAVRFSLSELTDSAPHVLTSSEVNHPWSAPKYDYKPTGRLQLQIANMPPYMGPIRRTWLDGKKQRIEDCIGDFMVGLTVAAAAIRKNRQETEESHRQREEERRIAEEHNRKAELVTELIQNWEEAVRLRKLMKAIEEETVRSDFSEEERNDLQQVVEWIRQYADTLDPLSGLPEAIEEFVRPENRYWWLE